MFRGGPFSRWGPAALVAAALLAGPAVASAHLERASYWPDPAPDRSVSPAAGGAVPKARSLGSALGRRDVRGLRVVCKPTSLKLAYASIRSARRKGYELRPSQGRQRISAGEATRLRRLNERFFERCRYRHIQAAVTKARNNGRVVVMPGTYHIQAVADGPRYGVKGSFMLIFSGPALVVQYGRTTEFSTRTNPGGTGDVAAPLLLPGNYTVTARYLGDGRRVTTHLHGTDPVPLTLIFTRSEYPATLTIEDCDVAIQGRVTDGDRQGIKGAHVIVEGRRGPAKVVKTRPDGGYRVEVKRGTYVVRARVGDEEVHPRRRTVTVKSKTARADFVVRRRRIKGLVVEIDGTGESGAAVRGVGGMRVVATGSDGKSYRAITDADGAFAIKATPGTYEVAPAMGAWDPPSREVELGTRRDVDGVDFERRDMQDESQQPRTFR